MTRLVICIIFALEATVRGCDPSYYFDDKGVLVNLNEARCEPSTSDSKRPQLELNIQQLHDLDHDSEAILRKLNEDNENMKKYQSWKPMSNLPADHREIEIKVEVFHTICSWRTRFCDPHFLYRYFGVLILIMILAYLLLWSIYSCLKLKNVPVKYEKELLV
jgi:hypothetical protein